MSGDSASKSFHGSLKYNYLHVPDDGKIHAVSFLDASEHSVIPLVDMLGPTAFIFVKNDVNGNISKLRKKHKENPDQFQTLQDMVDDEIEHKTTGSSGSATDALIWLVRGLHFICTFVKLLPEHDDSEDDMKPCLKSAYDKALKAHHNWLIQKTIPLAFKAAPYYSDMVKLLSNGVEKDVLMADIKRYVVLLEENIDAIQKYYVSKELEELPICV